MSVTRDLKKLYNRAAQAITGDRRIKVLFWGEDCPPVPGAKGAFTTGDSGNRPVIKLNGNLPPRELLSVFFHELGHAGQRSHYQRFDPARLKRKYGSNLETVKRKQVDLLEDQAEALREYLESETRRYPWTEFKLYRVIEIGKEINGH